MMHSIGATCNRSIESSSNKLQWSKQTCQVPRNRRECHAIEYNLTLTREEDLFDSVLPNLKSGMRILRHLVIQLNQNEEIGNQGEKKFVPVIMSMPMFLSRLPY